MLGTMRAQRVTPAVPETVGAEPRHWDYADAFECASTESRPAEQWARATLEHGPRALLLFVGFGWRYVLRLRLGPTNSEQHVAGWPIVLRTAETVVLEVESGMLGRARLTFRTAPSKASAS